MKLDQIYQVASDLKNKAEQVKMKDFEWRFLFAFDGKRTAQEIAVEQEIDEASASRLLRKLRRLAMLIDADMSLNEFLSRNALPALTTNPAKPSQTEIMDVTAENPASAPAAAPITFSITRTGGILSVPATPAPMASDITIPVSTPDGLAKDSTSITRNELSFSLRRNKFRLKPVIDFIVQQAGGGTVGQLAVYRVFLKIPANLLQEARVESLNLVTDDMEIDHPQFQRAVLNSVTETLGVNFPE